MTINFSTLITFLAPLPMCQTEESRRALINFAGLGSLTSQIQWGGAPKVFISLLLPLLAEYGILPDGRGALDALLDAIETDIGEDRKAQLYKIREALYTPINKSTVYSEEDIEYYLRFIESQCATLDPRRMPRGSKTHDVVLPLKDVFITLKAGQNNPLEREAEQNLLDLEVEELIRRLRLFDKEAHINENDFRYQKLVEECFMLSEGQREKSAIVKLHDVFRQHRWLVILGEPGSGKSTLIQWLAFQFANALLSKKDRVTVSPSQIGIESSEAEVDLGPTRFPILVRIADYASQLRTRQSLTLADYLGSQPILGQYPSIQQDKLAAISLNFLRRGEAMVLLDGLDEITDPADRRKICDQIEEFVRNQIKDPVNESAFIPWITSVGGTSNSIDRWWSHFEPSSPVEVGGNQVVITSRIAGYKAAVLRSEFAHYVIELLDDNSIVRFCKGWTLAVERYLARQSRVPISDDQIEKKASQEADALIETILQNKSIRKLAANPLLLTLLALIHREQSRLPTQRIRLYRQAVETLIQRRDVDLDEALVHDVLGPFALWLHENQPTGLATEAELRKQIGDALARWHGLDSSKPVAGKFNKEIDLFITAAREQSGLLVARGEGLYGFIHLTFQEYFVARELTRNPDQVISKLIKYLHRPRWREPLLFAIAYISDTQRGLLERVMLSVLNAEMEYEDILHQNLIFAADCVADSVWMPSRILHQIVNALSMIFADRARQGRFKALREQIIMAFERVYRRDTAEVIESVLISHLLGDDPKLRSAIGEILGRVPWSSAELFLALFKALSMPCEPRFVLFGFNAMIGKIPVPDEKLPPYALETLANLYGNDLEVTRAIDSLGATSDQATSFLRNWAEIVDPYVVPMIVRCLKLYNPLAPSPSASSFLTELMASLDILADNSAGLVYSSAVSALATLKGLQSAFEVIKNNIVSRRKFEESIYLLLKAFSPFLGEDTFEDWWNIFSPQEKQQFFEIAHSIDRSQLLEENAWIELSTTNSQLRTSALQLLLHLPHINLTPPRLTLLEPFLENPNWELTEIAIDLLQRANLADDAIEQTKLKLLSWLQSENEPLRACAALLLAESDHLNIDVYKEISLALRSGNDRWRQWASWVMGHFRLSSRISMDLINLSISFEWAELTETHDGMAFLAHTTFQTRIVHDTPKYVSRLIEELNMATDRNKQEMLQDALTNVHIYVPEVLAVLLQALKVTQEPLVQEAIVLSLGNLMRFGIFIRLPENTVSILSGLVKGVGNIELQIEAADTLGYITSDARAAYLELVRLCTSATTEARCAAARGLGTLAIYINQAKPSFQLNFDGDNWHIEQYTAQEGDIQFDRDEMRSKIFQQLKIMTTDGDLKLRSASLSACARVLLMGHFEPNQIIDELTELTNSDIEMLQILLTAGEGDDNWDSIACDCGRKFHSKLIETAHLMGSKSSLLFEQVARYTLEMLHLPTKQWARKRVPLAILASCSQELPAQLVQLSFAQSLQEKLIEAAKDTNSFNVRRFAIVIISQFRTVRANVIDVLVSGCRDLGIVQRSTFRAIASFRRIDTASLPQLVQMLSSSSSATVYAAAIIMRAIGNSHQAVREYGLRDSISNGIAQAIRDLTLPRYVIIGNERFELLDDHLFTTLVQVTSDNPQTILSDELMAESWLTFAGLREQNGGNLFGKKLQPEQLEQMREQAITIQESFGKQKFQVEEAGWKILIKGNQIIEEIEFNGIQQIELIDTINEAVKRSQKLATEELINSSQNLRSPIDLLKDLQAMPERAQVLQHRLEAQKIQVEKAGWQIVMTGTQKVESIEFNGDKKEELVKATNNAIMRSQQVRVLTRRGSTNTTEQMRITEEQPNVNISIPCQETSIQKISYIISNEYLHLMITPHEEGMPFSKRKVIFSTGTNLPVLDENRLIYSKGKNIRERTNIIVSFPYEKGIEERVSYIFNNGYLHLIIRRDERDLSFSEHEVVFTRGNNLPVLKKRKSLTINISFPHWEDAIDKVSYTIEDGSLNIVVTPGNNGLLFDKKDVVLSKGNHLPTLNEEQIRDMKQREANMLSNFIVSLPCQKDAVDKVSYRLNNNYLHIIIKGSTSTSFDVSKVRFTSSTKKTPDEEQKDYQRAIADYGQAITLVPDDPILYVNRGNIYLDLEDYQRAIADYDQAIELAPNTARYYNLRGEAYYTLKDYQRAIADYGQAIELAPNDAIYYVNRGNIYSMLEDYQRAIADYDQAIELAPNTARYYNLRGKAYYTLKDYQRAITNFDWVIELNPNDPDSYYDRGRAYRQIKEYQQAIADHNRTLELDPHLAWAYSTRGLTYIWLKDIKQGLADYRQSWELDPTNIYAGWMVEWSRMCQERIDPSIADRLEEIATVDSQDYLAYVCRGVALWIRKHYHEALAELDLAIQLNSEEWDAYFWKGLACASLGRDEEAFAALEKALAADLPPVLLTPLSWLEQDKPDFYSKYALSLLIRYK